MTKKKGKKKPQNKNLKTKTFFGNRQNQTIIGLFITLLGVFLFFSFISFLFSWEQDQSQLQNFTNQQITVKNWLGKIGATVSNFFIYKGFGVASIYFSILIFISGIFIFINEKRKKIRNLWGWGVLTIIWIAVTLGFLAHKNALLSGVIGYETNLYLQKFLGKTGLLIILFFMFATYLIIRFKITPESFKKAKKEILTEPTEKPIVNKVAETSNKEIELTKENTSEITLKKEETENTSEITIDVENIKEENHVAENLSDKLIKDFGEFDPTLELGSYTYPTLNLLKDYNETISINQEELEANKNRIVETLNNYKIGIDHIKATVGPTVTLYEIVPEAGIRISKIKNLEDDIALSLSALGIRIIAPIPGKGTIGIEVPNKKPTMVSMKSVISSTRFQKSEMQLPIALGKTISNETFVVDLAKMPHLLMAGATGQGKSVGLNVILTSLLYKKHPAEVKFVLVDPKKVELTLFNKIERHYLAKLPDSEEAIITDTTKVINTLNSLCIEMDNRYDLLKTAFVRNIKEYNTKFKARKLNPENGHKYLPYIVLVIDEFADLIMTAGKEVETPIARLAQLARAIGIHLIVATQRPSVNVITGLIKANFPARAAFRVTSKIDSRTILDAPGADQLIGKGDMLYSGGSEVIRLQCAFVDTPEIEKITDFIGSQRAYPDAHLLPEYVGEESGTSLDVDISERDSLFREAAMVIIIAQQGSASLLQRKLKLGYNRAGRIIDQLEAAGIVGPFEGSKARQVLIPDERALNELLDNEQN